LALKYSTRIIHEASLGGGGHEKKSALLCLQVIEKIGSDFYKIDFFSRPAQTSSSPSPQQNLHE